MSGKKPDNPSAFPITSEWREGGMTLRDYFAGQVIGNFIKKIDIDGDYPAQQRAEAAYMIADAMLKEREKPC